MEKVLVLDIETYGILGGKEQTMFNPMKSMYVDKVPVNKMIETVSITYKRGAEYVNTVFDWGNSSHRDVLVDWIQKCKEVGGTVCGHNLAFDMLYLRFCDSRIKELTDWDCGGENIRYEDTQILNFLDFEERPEKSLKSLVELFGLGSYRNDKVVGSTGTSSLTLDDYVREYNAKDTYLTYKLREFLWERLSKLHVSKIGKVCREHMSNLIRVGINMEENGIPVSRNKMLRSYGWLTKKIDGMKDECQRQGLLLSGKGSKKSKQNVVNTCFEWNNLIDDKRVQLTKVTREVSVGLDNLRLLLTELPHDHPQRRLVEIMQEFTVDSKTVSSFLYPLLFNPKKGGVRNHKGFICYPKWYLVPSAFGKADSNEFSGTIQGRVTCTDPAFQTWPSYIKKNLKSNLPMGRIGMADYNRLEIFVGAILSQDPVMLAECNEDVHTKTTFVICDYLGIKVDVKDPQFKKIWRQIGKTVNFLVLFKGQGPALRRTLMADAGKFKNYELLKVVDEKMTEEVCANIINVWFENHAVFGDWQDQLIAKATREGRIDLPTGWSRTFAGGEIAVKSTYINEICNFPIQCFASQLVQDTQMAMLKEFKKRGMSTQMCAQTYDSITCNIPFREVEQYEEVVEVTYPNPQLLDCIREQGLKTVPLGYEIEYII